MHHTVRATIAAVVTAVVAACSATAWAQAAMDQIKLTEKHVEGFIAAQKDMSAVVEKMQGAASRNPNPRYEAELEAVTKKHGFKNFAEYEAVAANISMVMAAIDPQTKAFTDPQSAIKKEIEDIAADKTVPDNEKKQLLQALKAAQHSRATSSS